MLIVTVANIMIFLVVLGVVLAASERIIEALAHAVQATAARIEAHTGQASLEAFLEDESSTG